MHTGKKRITPVNNKYQTNICLYFHKFKEKIITEKKA